MSQQNTDDHLAKAIGAATAGAGCDHSLRSIFMFRSLTSNSLRSLADRCDWESYLAGETIIEYGEESTNVFFLTSGSVHVLNYTITGRAISFARLGEGSVFMAFKVVANQGGRTAFHTGEHGLVEHLSAEFGVEDEFAGRI